MSFLRDLCDPAMAFSALPPSIAADPEIRAVEPAAAVAEFFKNLRLPTLFLSIIYSPYGCLNIGVRRPDKLR